jgi:hypothetical protein
MVQLIDFLIRRCHVNTYSRYKHVHANILALWMFISWIGKADRRCEMVINLEAGEKLHYFHIAYWRSKICNASPIRQGITY